MEQFDYVIVGGGTAACVLANRLSEDGKHTILMLEAGGEPRSMWISIPAGFTKLLNDPVYNWRFETKPENSVLGRTIAQPPDRRASGPSCRAKDHLGGKFPSFGNKAPRPCQTIPLRPSLPSGHSPEPVHGHRSCH